jgi:hypothetical protein
MSLTKLSLAGNNLIIPDQSDIPAGDGKIDKLFTVYKKDKEFVFVHTAQQRLDSLTGQESVNPLVFTP